LRFTDTDIGDAIVGVIDHIAWLICGRQRVCPFPREICHVSLQGTGLGTDQELSWHPPLPFWRGSST
jgi:hypothetical protein